MWGFGWAGSPDALGWKGVGLAVGRGSARTLQYGWRRVPVGEHSGCPFEHQPTHLPGEEEQEALGLPCHRAEVASLLEGERKELDA